MRRDKEVAHKVLHRNEIASYELLLWYAKKVQITYLRSIVVIDNDEEHCRRVFQCPFLFLKEKNKHKPMLFLDRTHLVGKYNGALLGAIERDENETYNTLIVDNKIDN